MFNTVSEECLECVNSCKGQFLSEGSCYMFSPMPTKKEIKHFNYLLVKKKIKLKKICKNRGLRFERMKNMLRSKESFDHKYLKVLKENIKDHWSDEELGKYDYRFDNYV